METLWQDLRYGARMLLKKPGFTLVAGFALALGIGANTAIFSVVNAILLRPLPYRDPDRLTMIWADNPAMQLGFNELPPTNADVIDWREQNHVFERIAALNSNAANLSAQGEPERVGGASVTADFFPLIGVEPIRGRVFTAEEDQPGKHRVAVISYGLWQRRFGGDPALVGRAITLDAVGFTVVGIMPPGFHFPRGAEMPAGYGLLPQTDVWTPLAYGPERWRRRDQRNLIAMGRLKPGVTLGQAQAEMSAIARRLAADYPDSNAGWVVKLKPLQAQVAGQTRPALLVLLAAVGFVLLIACANVASLLLARANARRKEIAVRAVLGAGRRRIIRQLLTESVLLSLLGGVVGLGLGYWGVTLLVAVSPQDIPRLREASLDLRVLGFTLSVSLLTGLLFGLAPALQVSQTNLNEALQEGGRGAGTSGHRRMRQVLMVAEVALALVLLVGAGLMVRSFSSLLKVDPGFNPQSVLAFDIALPGAKYATDEKLRSFYQQVLARVASLPGVRAAGATSDIPLGGAENLTFLVIEGAPPVPRGQEPVADDRAVTPGYFQAMGIPLVVGRLFTERDGADRPPVVIINEAIARRYFPRTDPVGRRIKFDVTDGKEPWQEIVGVVGDVRSSALELEPRPQVYRPHAQNTWGSMTVVVRAEADPWQLTAPVRAEVKAVDANQPVTNLRTMERVVSESLARRRFNTLLLTLFAAVALLLTVVGLYGVISYSVSQRTHEIGIRLALGASRIDVLRLVLGQGMGLVLIGLALGWAGAFALTRLMAGLLYGVTATDPMTFAGIPLLLAGVALLACYLPARKATRVNPVTALRYE